MHYFVLFSFFVIYFYVIFLWLRYGSASQLSQRMVTDQYLMIIIFLFSDGAKQCNYSSWKFHDGILTLIPHIAKVVYKIKVTFQKVLFMVLVSKSRLSNSHFHILNNITHISIYFFTHAYCKKLQTAILKLLYQTPPKYV